jgi:hypothetical protein
MLFHRKILYLISLLLFFSCQAIQPAHKDTASCVLSEDYENFFYSGHFTDFLSQVSLPEILGVPVEIIPIEVLRNDIRKNDYNTEQVPLLLINFPPKYLEICRIILPAMRSTEIGYPFHAFW